jgi:hypothetical protein
MTEKGQKYYKGKKHHWAFLLHIFGFKKMFSDKSLNFSFYPQDVTKNQIIYPQDVTRNV